jgi:hypothetical protein
LAGKTANSVYYCDALWWPWKFAKTLPQTSATKELATA